MGDVVMMHVDLAGDPAKGGKLDFIRMMAAYTRFFGTKDQPNKPAPQRHASRRAGCALGAG